MPQVLFAETQPRSDPLDHHPPVRLPAHRRSARPYARVHRDTGGANGQHRARAPAHHPARAGSETEVRSRGRNRDRSGPRHSQPGRKKPVVRGRPAAARGADAVRLATELPGRSPELHQPGPAPQPPGLSQLVPVPDRLPAAHLGVGVLLLPDFPGSFPQRRPRQRRADGRVPVPGARGRARRLGSAHRQTRGHSRALRR